MKRKKLWYHRPCPVCQELLENPENIRGDTNVCSKVCKYAWLSVNYANDFTHIPTKIRSYINKNCEENYFDVALRAEQYCEREKVGRSFPP